MKQRSDDPEVTRRRDAWTDDVCREFGLDRETIAAITPELLQLVAGVAHGPARPAGPITALLVGIAATRDGGEPSAEALRAQIARVGAMLDGWQP
ncbi:DUF6457 domain-containing protein [Luteococcus sp. H138]|uniref:DUF6457 domain-containing protein n=1 Tax=unclassified Luteococcus TaxID=2639923 RepID=UPI00313DEEB7